MSLSTQVSVIQHNPNGITTSFAYPYYFLEASHLVAVLTVDGEDQEPFILNTDYTVTGVLNPAGGAINFGVAPAAGTKLTIYRNVPITQLVDYVVDDNFPAETHEQALDKLTMICQYLAALLDRTVRAPLTDPAMDPLKGFVQIPGIAVCINGDARTVTLLGKFED